MTRTSPPLQDHTEYNATGVDVHMTTDVVKLGLTIDLTPPFDCSAITMLNNFISCLNVCRVGTTLSRNNLIL